MQIANLSYILYDYIGAAMQAACSKQPIIFNTFRLFGSICLFFAWLAKCYNYTFIFYVKAFAKFKSLLTFAARKRGKEKVREGVWKASLEK
jgi:hypothetical protein